ncbi:NAD(P)H-binding protein [Micromonospora rifamycinica]|uniref:NmrA family NAD(P)-binding protein n=1 Tax=Micromonospora rifamycinica TaxID=291594 RepID=UPI0033C572FE
MIVVTTPTGAIGRQVLARLVDRQAPVRVIVRDPSRLPAPLLRKIDVVVGSHRDPAVVARAFTDAQAVFWLVPVDPRATDPTSTFMDFTRPACAALRRGTVRRVVGISALGRGFGRPAGLATASLAMDDLIAGTGVAYRALTMPAFMENLFMHARTIRDQGVIYSPVAADLPLPTVATRDVAAVAARLLRDGAWTGQDAVPLLGPEDLTFDEIARILTEVLGRSVRYQRIPVERYMAALAGQGLSAPMARAMADMLTAKNDGLDQLVGRSPEHATPTRFRDWCRQVFAPALDSVAVESSSRRFS